MLIMLLNSPKDADARAEKCKLVGTLAPEKGVHWAGCLAGMGAAAASAAAAALLLLLPGMPACQIV